MAGRHPSMPKKAWMEEEDKVNASPAQQPDELTEVQVLQAGWDQTEQEQQQQQDRDQKQEQEAIAVKLDERVVGRVVLSKHAPNILKSIYQWLVSNTKESAQHRLDKSLLELAEEHPHDVVVTLLRCSPSCDRVDKYLRQSLPYLQSPQQPLRLEAVRFIGLIARQVEDWHEEELPIIYEAIQGMTDDISSSVSSLATQTLFIIQAAVSLSCTAPGVRRLSYRLRKAWKTKCSALSFLCCCCRA